MTSILHSTITLWNRLEGTPRAENFDRALKAEIRDPLWMISKQWQMGEYEGEDAASAVLAKVHIKTTQLHKYQPVEGITSGFDEETPLEVKVEHQEIPFTLAGQKISMDLRLLMGRHWLKLLKPANNDLRNEYLKRYTFVAPDALDPEDVPRCAHIEVWQSLSAVSNILKKAPDASSDPVYRPDIQLRNCMDGYQLYAYLKESPSHHAYDGIAGSESEVLRNQIDDLAARFVAWFENLYYQPIEEKNPSWRSSYLEHQFACSAPKEGAEKVFMADEYYHGHLDWYNLDIHDTLESLPEPSSPASTFSPEKAFTLSFIPTPVKFPGMPHNRWWQLEDWQTNLGSIKPSTPDINQLMLLDFGLNYANDWFIVPFTLPVGSIAEVSGMMVTNVFGENIWVQAAGRGRDEEWNRWSMFHLNVRGKEDIPADLSMLLLPAAPKVLEGRPLEEVYMLRDEIANMVWGVESKVPLATGKSKSGKEAGMELKERYLQMIEPVEPPPLIPNEAKIRYQVVNSVPENWIPFIPVHKDNDKREIQIQRAAMPRILEGADGTIPPKKIEPRTPLLREGLDNGQTYHIHEEEIPGEGIRIHRSYQRTRWYDGKVFTWLGFRKQVGRGKGHSGLAFDQISPKENRK